MTKTQIVNIAVELAVQAEREACAAACLNEQVSGETGTPEDEAYNRACRDCHDAIRRRG